MKFIYTFLAIFTFIFSQAQTSKIYGVVTSKNNLTPLANASVTLGKQNVLTDSLGRFNFTTETGAYTLNISLVGYLPSIRNNITLTSGNEIQLQIEMEPNVVKLSDIVLTSNTKKTARAATLETPLSVQRLTTEEIKSNPGGNFDISKVIQSLPGVGGTAGSVGAFRNDIIIRGGAPNENVYYLDGIEIPVINHFATQGSAGGPAGILNVSFIEDVKLSSSAFDARFDNTLSSIFEFKQKKGNQNRFQGNVRLSATELATTFEGPVSKNTSFIASARRSYLQLLFKAIDLPIRPNFWDFQFKSTTQLSKKTTLNIIGVGAIDEFEFAAPKDATPEKLYIINDGPIIQQKNYTIGASIKHLVKNGFINFNISRNLFKNELDKFIDNNDRTTERTLLSRSTENENKLRFDVNKNMNGFKLSYGILTQLVGSNNKGFAVIRKEIRDGSNNIIQPEIKANFNSDINFLRLGLFAQMGKRFFDNKLGANLGFRVDGNTFTNNGMNLLNTFSPRFSLSYVVASKVNINASVGSYYKILPYTALGFQNNADTYVNKNTKYTNCIHYVTGVEYLPNSNTRFTFESFFKKYNNVAVSVRTGASLANEGGDFGVIGNEEIITNGKGETYGFEFFAQQKLTKRFFGVLSYTYFNSKYSGADQKLKPSSWDNKNLLSLTWGYKFNRYWELGLKFRYQGGVPYTPFDNIASQQNYLSLGKGILNYNLLNTQRLSTFNASDVRIDKKWNFRKFTFNFFLDVTNWYVAKSPALPNYTFKRNATNTNFLTTNNLPIAADGSNAIPFILNNNDASTTPTFGLIFEF